MNVTELPLDPFSDRLLTSVEVAALFRVGTKTVGRWAKDGKIEHILTPGNRRRFRESIVRTALLRYVEGEL